MQEKLETSSNIIDLGCGNHPAKGAKVGVDCYIEPVERTFGSKAKIDVRAFKERGIEFVNARIGSRLPFRDEEFDFAYSHHVFEHLDDPATACLEMMRIAKEGVIITPSVLAELIFGRPYHRWLVMDRNNLLLFFRKRTFEDRAFGEHPLWDDKRRKWAAEKETNPFDILLNDGGWHKGREAFPRLASYLRRYWYSHAPVMEVIFMWERKFEFKIYE